ncbi:Dabb family protein [Tundrisphaera lichenicola]|uniref:Dabb family protein n=1 Tax=Tundrisphaera lichenicola TaxID=2029860 RepID=UPI003EB9C6AE
MIAHNVFFKLTDDSEAARVRLIQACKTYLTGHPGLVFFAVGGVEPSLSRPVNDKDFDVALHMVFATLKDQDDYQVAPRHNQFIAENKENWAKVRVFDSTVETA